MSYALVIDQVIRAEGGMPRSARRLDTSEWVHDLITADAETRQATGWHEVADTPRPADDTTDTYLRTLDLVDGSPTVVWVAQRKPLERVVAELAAVNKSSIETNLAADLAVMQIIIDAPPPSAVDIASLRAAARERKDIARMLRRVVRHVLGAFEGVD